MLMLVSPARIYWILVSVSPSSIVLKMHPHGDPVDILYFLVAVSSSSHRVFVHLKFFFTY